jgi:hypothetical protein
MWVSFREVRGLLVIRTAYGQYVVRIAGLLPGGSGTAGGWSGAYGQ